MIKKDMILSSIILFTTFINGNEVNSDVIEIDTSGELRLGAVQIKDITGNRTSTLSLGGKVGIETKPISGLSTGVTFYTTNALFGKASEAMFLDSESKSYAIVGEAFVQATFSKTEIKAGRQLFESPFINGDDIGMIPDIVEGYSIFNRNIKDTTLVLGAFYKWSGIDSDTPQKFTKIQKSGKPIVVGGLIFEGLKNITAEAWYYKVNNSNWNYFETKYKNDKASIGLQYSHQGSGNSVYGIDAVFNLSNLSLHSAYNNVSGTISNGFGGGPFFTSSEDHTVHETLDTEAKLIGAEYSLGNLTLAVSHVTFSKAEDETDYSASYAFNDDLTADLIHSDMNHDGEMSRFFINYNF